MGRVAADFISAAGGAARWKMAFIFGVGMAGMLGIGFVLARSFSSRIQHLLMTANNVTAGDLRARTKVASDDELGQLARSLNRMTDRLEGQYIATMRTLASAVAGNNLYVVQHSARVGELATRIGRQLGVDDLTLAQLEIGGFLHDVGKIGARNAQLVSADFVSEAVKRFVDTHPHIGVEEPHRAETARKPVMDFIGYHHGGDKLNPSDIPLVGRVVAIADLYDSLTADRPDAHPMSSEEALEVLRAAAGSIGHFGAVEALATILPAWERSQGRGSEYRETAAKAARLKAEGIACS